MQLSNSAITRATDCFTGIELGDARRTRRLRELIAKLAFRPDATLPQAMGSVAALEGLYRFANNPNVEPEVLFDSQAQNAAKRARHGGGLKLVLHDTTSVSFPHAEPDELGYLNTGKAGFLLHAALLVDAEEWRRPLGIVSAETIHRTKRSKPRARGAAKPRKKSGSETNRSKDRESLRWNRGVERAAEVLGDIPHVHIMDREGDNYILLSKMAAMGQRFVVRCRLDRNAREPGSEEWSLLNSLKEGLQGVLDRKVDLSARKRQTVKTSHSPRAQRTAKLTFAAKTVELRRPQYVKDEPEQLRLNLVVVSETKPPNGEVPIEWLLYTTEDIATIDQVAAVVDMYRTRWTIEEYFKALKTGCLYEDRRFESRHALLVLLAMTLPVACELLWLRSRARTNPDAPATDVLTPLQLRLLREIGSHKLPPNPTARAALMAVAALGGHQRNNGDPGWLVLHRGLRTILACEIGWNAAQRAGAEM